MTASQLALVTFGFIVNALTFGLGICVGISLTRKDSPNDSDSDETKDPRWWHDVRSASVSGSTANGIGGGADEEPETNLAKRAHLGRRRLGNGPGVKNYRPAPRVERP
jgi:hypothetical protein